MERLTPLFDTLCNLEGLVKKWQATATPSFPEMVPDFAHLEYKYSVYFLHHFRGSEDTYNAYRREVERLLAWSWWIKKSSILNLSRVDLESYIEFTKAPPQNWIGTKIVSRFIETEEGRIANPLWRPYIAKVTKSAFRAGKRAKQKQYQLSSESIRQIFAILSTYFEYLIQEEITEKNPVALIRQKSKYIQKKQTLAPVRRLSQTQWQIIMQCAENMAKKNPMQHERTLFLMTALYDMYLRISELCASKRHTPRMNDFFRDSEGNWWFRTVGKGNKLRQIAVSTNMLEALKRYRTFLELTPIPAIDENTYLFSKVRGGGPITSSRSIRFIVQRCFDDAIAVLESRGEKEEARALASATVHWLRHTGISEDVKVRPREHVRDDAGHSSSAITDRYIDIELKERAKSAKKKRALHDVEEKETTY